MVSMRARAFSRPRFPSGMPEMIKSGFSTPLLPNSESKSLGRARKQFNSAVEACPRKVASMVARQSRVDLTRQDSRFRTSCGQSQSEGPVARSQLDDLPAIGFRNRSDHLRDEEPLRRHNAAGLSMFYQAGPEEVQVRCSSVRHSDYLVSGICCCLISKSRRLQGTAHSVGRPRIQVIGQSHHRKGLGIRRVFHVQKYRC